MKCRAIEPKPSFRLAWLELCFTDLLLCLPICVRCLCASGGIRAYGVALTFDFALGVQWKRAQIYKSMGSNNRAYLISIFKKIFGLSAVHQALGTRGVQDLVPSLKLLVVLWVQTQFCFTNLDFHRSIIILRTYIQFWIWILYLVPNHLYSLGLPVACRILSRKSGHSHQLPRSHLLKRSTAWAQAALGLCAEALPHMGSTVAASIAAVTLKAAFFPMFLYRGWHCACRLTKVLWGLKVLYPRISGTLGKLGQLVTRTFSHQLDLLPGGAFCIHGLLCQALGLLFFFLYSISH